MAAVRLAGDVSELRRLAGALQRAGEQDAIGDAIMSAVVSEVQPLRGEARAYAGQILPSRGGLAAEVARQPMPVSYSGSKRRGVRVRIDVRPGRGKGGVADPGAINRGRLRHPVFGDRESWVTQAVPAGWFSVPMAKGAPRVEAAIVEALRREVAKLQAGG